MSTSRRPPKPPAVSPHAASTGVCALCGAPLGKRQRRYCSNEHRLAGQSRRRLVDGRGPIETAAASGDRLATLRALRDRLAAEIDATSNEKDLATLSARFVEVLVEIGKAGPARDESATPLAQVLQMSGQRSAAARRGRLDRGPS